MLTPRSGHRRETYDSFDFLGGPTWMTPETYAVLSVLTPFLDPTQIVDEDSTTNFFGAGIVNEKSTTSGLLIPVSWRSTSTNPPEIVFREEKHFMPPDPNSAMRAQWICCS